MSREDHSPSTTSTPKYIGAKRLPPWEVSDIPRVVTRSAPVLLTTEMQATPTLWAAATTTTLPGHPTKSGVEESFPDSTFASPSPPSRTVTGFLSERKLSLADSARAASPHLNEHKHMVPAYEVSYEPVRPSLVALHGTMSSRATHDQTHMASGKIYDKRHQRKESKELTESTPLGHRFTSAVEGLFRKDPINDVQFEHIGERHWSEDSSKNPTSSEHHLYLDILGHGGTVALDSKDGAFSAVTRLNASTITTAGRAGCESEIEYPFPRQTSQEEIPQAKVLIPIKCAVCRRRAWLSGYMYISC